MKQKESDIYEEVARHLNRWHPDVTYHFDLGGVHNPSPVSRSLYQRLNERGWPDLTIAKPMYLPEAGILYHGCYIEIKLATEKLKKRNGQWKTEHIAEQAHMIDLLRDQDYIADFACGTVETLGVIHSYLGKCDELIGATF